MSSSPTAPDAIVVSKGSCLLHLLPSRLFARLVCDTHGDPSQKNSHKHKNAPPCVKFLDIWLAHVTEHVYHKIEDEEIFNGLQEPYAEAVLRLQNLLQAVSNSQISTSDLLPAIDSDLWTVREKMAERRDLPNDAIMKLMRDPVEEVRATVAMNPNVTVEQLRKLASDASSFVRGQVPLHRACSPEIVQLLSMDPVPHVRRMVARTPLCTAKAFHLLSLAKEELVREAVAYNQYCPADTLASLAKDPVMQVRRGVATNPNTPAAVLKELALDRSGWIRLAVANNEATTEGTLHEMLAMPDEDVRVVARLRLGSLARKSH